MSLEDALNEPLSDPPSILSNSRALSSIVAALVAGALAVFLLPYFVPVQPSISESYLVGFNNRISLLSLLLFLFLFAWWTRGFGLRAPEPSGVGLISRPSRVLLYAAMAMFFAFSLAEWLLQRAHPAMNEAVYFLDRLQHLVQGRAPYMQFEFPYGPLLLYFPLALAHLFHVSIMDAYYLSWIVQMVAGVWLIYGCVRLLPSAPAHKNAIFLILVLTWGASLLSFGVNYTPFRFFLAPFFGLLAARRFASGSKRAGTVLWLLCGVAALLLVSPEQAIALLGALTLFLLLLSVQTRAGVPLLQAGVLLAGAIPCLVVANRVGLFNTLKVMGGGGYNFPLVPVPSQIPIFGLLVVTACVLVNTVRDRRTPGAVDLLILLGLFSLPAAFGRADIGHFIVNTMAVTLAAASVLSAHPKLFRPALWSYAALVTLLPAALMLSLAIPAQRGNRTKTLALGSGGFQARRSTPPAEPLAPFGRPLPNSPELPYIAGDTGFYNGLELVTAPAQVEQKIQELRLSPERDLLIPASVSCTFVFERHSLRRALLTPFVPHARRSSEIRQPLCGYIHLHYHPSPVPSGLAGYELWTPIAPS